MLTMVYVAPMKALLQEMAGNFNSRLRSFGIKVGELTSDSQMEQISDYVRLVGFSVTLPNHTSPLSSTWTNLRGFFASYRPCALQQQFVGVTEERHQAVPGHE